MIKDFDRAYDKLQNQLAEKAGKNTGNLMLSKETTKLLALLNEEKFMQWIFMVFPYSVDCKSE